jgi:hypothetical protein
MKSRALSILSKLIVLVAAVVSGTVFAGPIQFIYTGTGSGTSNGNAFSNAAFTITETADTSSRQACGAGCFFIDDKTASINIAGVGSLTFVTGTRTLISGSEVFFARASFTGSDLFDGPANAALSGYDLLTSIGPITGSGSLAQWISPSVVTSGGVLIFTNGISDASFRAIAGIASVPEPQTWFLLGAGALGFGLARRKRT